MRDPGAISKWRLYVATCLLWTSLVAAQAPEQDSWTIALDNDSWGSTDEDSNYTHGMRITRRSDNIPGWLLSLANPLRCHACTQATAAEYELGQEIYTPFHTFYPHLIPWDRPYAGWLYGQVGLLADTPTASPRRSNFSAIRFQLGVVGPASFAEQAQRVAHRALSKPMPQGWENGLENELGFVVSYKRGQRFELSSNVDSALSHRLSPYILAAIGNVDTHVGAGAEFRSLLRAGGGFNNGERGLQLFVNVQAKAVIRNIFLDGNTWSPSHSVERESLVTETAFGLQYQARTFGIRLARHDRSKEFADQPLPDSYSTLTVWLGQRIHR